MQLFLNVLWLLKGEKEGKKKGKMCSLLNFLEVTSAGRGEACHMVAHFCVCASAIKQQSLIRVQTLGICKAGS